MPSFATTDLCDAHGTEVAVLPAIFRDFGGDRTFAGPVETISVADDNVLVRQALEEDGAGSVLVVDGGGSLACALLGDQLATLALTHGWAGLIVHGCVRDVARLVTIPIGMKAIGAHPRRSGKLGGGMRGGPLEIGGVRIAPGMFVYADADGIVVSDRPLI
ncbi:MAG: ribonuclease E activity regulator RraA [Actinomycetota bacterium]